MASRKKPPEFSDFRLINIPITPVRQALAALSAADVETMPLEAFLLLIHKIVKEEAEKNK